MTFNDLLAGDAVFVDANTLTGFARLFRARSSRRVGTAHRTPDARWAVPTLPMNEQSPLPRIRGEGTRERASNDGNVLP